MTQTAGFTLRRRAAPRALISLVAMIDVLLILLVFFMVTSTYLDLDMIPALARDSAATGTAGGAPAQDTSPLLIRIGQDGQPVVRGRALSPAELDTLIRTRLAASPGTPVVILPSGAAQAQALISVMDRATLAGASEVSVIRLEARP
jgi:biopolymer transport protein ExbD